MPSLPTLRTSRRRRDGSMKRRREVAPVTALVLCHCESVNSSILTTSIESFDRHFAVNARASWLLIAEHARRFPRGRRGAGRIIALTSDHTVDNLPDGASKGALGRIVLAAAQELTHLRITANGHCCVSRSRDLVAGNSSAEPRSRSSRSRRSEVRPPVSRVQPQPRGTETVRVPASRSSDRLTQQCPSKRVTPRTSKLCPSPRVPDQCHSLQVVSPS